MRPDQRSLALAIDCSWFRSVQSNPVLLTGSVFVLVCEIVEVLLDARRLQFGCPQFLPKALRPQAAEPRDRLARSRQLDFQALLRTI
jgi:hypothetical protein